MKNSIVTKAIMFAFLGMVVGACGSSSTNAPISGYPGPVGHYSNATHKICGDANPASCIDVTTCIHEGDVGPAPSALGTCNPAKCPAGCNAAPDDLACASPAQPSVSFIAGTCSNGCFFAGWAGNYNSTCFQ